MITPQDAAQASPRPGRNAHRPCTRSARQSYATRRRVEDRGARIFAHLTLLGEEAERSMRRPGKRLR